MRPLIRNLLLGLGALTAALLAGAVFTALELAGPAADDLRGALVGYALLALAVFALALLLLRRQLESALLRPIDAVARDVHTLLQAKRIDRALRVPEGHRLGELPEALSALVDELRGARREAVRAAASVSVRLAQQKDWLEVILLELIREGVVVCSADHRILLYNHPAARLFHGSPALGLGRSLFDVVAEEPVRHALERLEFRRQHQRHELATSLVCATRDARVMLSARVALILDEAKNPAGYVLALDDISGDLAERQVQSRVRRAITRDVRRPLASLRAAAEALSSYPDMNAEQRLAFHDMLLAESARLSEHVDELSAAYEGGGASEWPMVDIHSPDLFGCVARRLQEDDGLALAVEDAPAWLRGDSHALLELLLLLCRRLAERSGEQGIEAAAGRDDSRSYIELRWRGDPVPHDVLDGWMAEPMPNLAGRTVGDLLEQHGSEPWSRRADAGRALLHLPLPPPLAMQEAAPAPDSLPARPEFYDFDLMYDYSDVGHLAGRPLRSLTFVVFDTETTGLNPGGGDRVISIGGVRVTQGRMLEGETFESLVNPGRPIPKDSIRFHGITDEMVATAPPLEQVLPRFHLFVGDAVLVAHNAAFDMKFLKLAENAAGVRFGNPVIDTLLLSLLIEGYDEEHSLDAICERLDIEVEGRHSALGDALATARVLEHLLERLEARGIVTFEQVMDACNMEAALRFRAAQF